MHGERKGCPNEAKSFRQLTVIERQVVLRSINCQELKLTSRR
jgi:hypothetical protein